MKNIFIIAIFLLTSNYLIGQGYFDYMAENDHKSFQEKKEYLDHYYESHDRGKGSGYKQYRRWLHVAISSLDENEHAVNNAALNFKAYRKVKKDHFVEQSGNRSQNGQWRSEGPTSYLQGNSGWNGGNGRVNRIFYHPTQPNTFYAGTPAGGLWRTMDDGSNWASLTDGLPRIGAAGLVIDPDDSDQMYLLTGDNDDNHNYSIGLLTSIDGGNNWQPSGLTFGADSTVRARKLAMHPTNHDTLYVATDDGFLRSSDRGQTWSTLLIGNFFDFEFQPNNPDRMYLSSFGSVFISNNAGTTWTEINDADFPIFNSRIEIAVTPADSNYVYLLYGLSAGTGKFLGLFKSTDAGSDFSFRSDSPNILGYNLNGQDNSDQGAYDLALSVDPSNETVVYVGGINIWKSINGGTTWDILTHWQYTNNSTGYAHADIHELTWKGTDLMCASDGGVFRSSNGGNTWVNQSDGLVILQTYNIDVENNIINCGTQDNGSNNWIVGTTTAVHSLGSDGFSCLIDPSDNGVRYQSTNTSIGRSTDYGVNYFEVNVPNNSNYEGVDWILHPTRPDTMYVGLFDVYRSFNRGTSWTDLNASVGSRTVEIAQSSANGDRLYAASSSAVRRSDNANAGTPSWNDATPNLPLTVNNRISCITVDPDEEDRIWLGLHGFVNGEKVYVSANAGATWTNITGNLANIPIRSLMSEPGAANGIYAGTDIGVFYRNDNLGNWIYYSTGLPVTLAGDLDIDNGRLFAGTFGRGIWSTPLYGGCTSGIILTQADAGNGEQIHVSSDFISSTQIIQGGLGTNIQYKTGNEITLTTGFHAQKDNLFEAKLDGCN